jgi:cytochrome c-type biogenesis protein
MYEQQGAVMSKFRPWFFAMIILLLIFFPTVSAEGNIKSVMHSPREPSAGQDITIFVEVNSTLNITEVKLEYCTVEPAQCYVPITLTLGDNNTYSAQITRDFEGGTTIEYNITITYDNGSEEFSPVGSQYHYINLTGEPTQRENNLLIALIIIIVIIIIFTVVYYMIKRKSQKVNKKVIAAGISTVLILSALAAVLFVIGQGPVEKFPDFTLTDIDGNTFNLTDYRGQVVLLDMMSIECKNCKIVEKDLKEIYPEYEDEVVFITIDILAGDTDEMLRDYREDHEIEWTISRDTRDGMFLKYTGGGIPKVLIIDAEGYVTFEHSDLVSSETLERELDLTISGQAQAIAIQQASFFSLAIIAGIVSFFSPCAFPMLPGYMAYYLRKYSEEGGEIPLRRSAVAGTVSATGIIVVYLAIGIVVVFAGTSVMQYISIFGLIVGIILIALGILLFTPLQYWKIVRPFQNFWARIRSSRRKKTGEGCEVEDPSAISGTGFYGGMFLYGLGYGAAAAGCTAPIFIAVILTALVTGSLLLGIILLILYTITAALLMLGVTIAIAYFGAGAAQKLSKYTEVIKRVSGAVLIVVGAYLIWINFAAM